MWNRHQFSQSGLLTAVALCSALSFTACSDDDDGPGAADAADATVRDSAADVRREAEAGSEAGSDARTPDAAGDVVVEARADAGADARSDVAAETGADAGTDAGRDGAADTGTDARTDAATDAGADVRIEAGVDAGLDVRAEAEAAVLPVDTGVPTEAGVDATTVDVTTVDATTVDGAVDAAVQTLRYDFELTLQNWVAEAAPDGGTAPLTVGVSTAQASTGTGSMIVNFVSPDSHEITVLDPPAGLERGTFTFRIFVPLTSTLTLLKPFTSTDENQIEYYPIVFAESDRGAWKTYTANFPLAYTVDGGAPRARTEIEQLGFQLEGTGSIYIDSITY